MRKRRRRPADTLPSLRARSRTPVNTPDAISTLHKRPGAVRWAVGAGLVFMTGVGMVLLFLLTLATRNRALYEQNFGWLVAINVAVAGFLLLVIVWLGARLALRFKRGKFGSRLLIKLAAIIGLVGVLPGLLIYTVSYQYVSRSIESWFDVKVEAALVAGLNLGRATLDTLSTDLSKQARVAATQLSDVPDVSAGIALEKMREQIGVSDAVLWTASGRMVASAGQSRFQIRPERPAPVQFKEARQKGSVEKRQVVAVHQEHEREQEQVHAAHDDHGGDQRDRAPPSEHAKVQGRMLHSAHECDECGERHESDGKEDRREPRISDEGRCHERESSEGEPREPGRHHLAAGRCLGLGCRRLQHQRHRGRSDEDPEGGDKAPAQGGDDEGGDDRAQDRHNRRNDGESPKRECAAAHVGDCLFEDGDAGHCHDGVADASNAEAGEQEPVPGCERHDKGSAAEGER